MFLTTSWKGVWLCWMLGLLAAIVSGAEVNTTSRLQRRAVDECVDKPVCTLFPDICGNPDQSIVKTMCPRKCGLCNTVNYKTDVQHQCNITFRDITFPDYVDNDVIPDYNDDNPCYKWRRDAGYTDRYNGSILIHGLDFWKVTVTLEVNYTNMMPWYNNTLNVRATFFRAPVCKIDLEMCTDATTPIGRNVCKCINMTDVAGKPGFKKYSVYINQKADKEQQHLVLELQPKAKNIIGREAQIFYVGYDVGYLPTIHMACKARCDLLKKNANNKCDYFAGKKTRCETEGCPCIGGRSYYPANERGTIAVPSSLPDLPRDFKGTFGAASDAAHVVVSMTPLASLLYFWTALVVESF